MNGSATLERPVAPPRADRPAAGSALGAERALDKWLAIQGINLDRHAKSLRNFDKAEFGTGPASPSEAHIEAANRFLSRFREKLIERSRWVDAAVAAARREPSEDRLRRVLVRKQAISTRVTYVEGIWDFYFDLFVQRLSKFGERLRAVDRIGANCYEDLYVGMGTAKPTPTLLPFSYAQSGFSPLTYRRGVPVTRLRRQPNPFPLIMLPQHRLENVWALSSVLHEVSHNLQADLGMWELLPKIIQLRMTEDRIPEDVAEVWARWNKEITADVFALLFGGPAAVESLMDVVGRAPGSTVKFSALSAHPTPFLRVGINLVLLRRLGFSAFADNIERIWKRLYPGITPADIPPAFAQTFDRAAQIAVDAMAFQPYKQFGKKSLAQILEFGLPQMQMIEEAANRLAAAGDPGAIPPRFMIGAARLALDRGLATPQAINDQFYRVLGRR
ncbi:MAG TPA: hypothetical protein VGI19_17410 [Candidatus Cybelea sp.]|jgi:hypothetical protein